jgi:predicted nucleic acid-binding protein
VARRLIDTDVMIDASRGRAGAAAIIDSFDDVTISIITAHELIVGARNQRDAEYIDRRELSLEVPEY